MRARLLHSRSVLELRARPQRLTSEIGEFVAECWSRAAGGGLAAA